MMFGLRSGTVTFDLSDPSMVLPRRFRGKRCCALVLRHATGRGKAAPRPRPVTRRSCSSSARIPICQHDDRVAGFGKADVAPVFPSHFTESGGWTRDPIESPRTPPRWRVSLADEEPTTAAVRRHLDTPAGDVPAESIVR